MGLVEEGVNGGEHTSMLLCAAGFAAGCMFIYVTKRHMDEHGDAVHVLDLDSLDAKKVVMVMSVMTLHSLSEGIGVGVSYHSQSLGSFIMATLAVHNIPEGVAIAIVMLPRGVHKLDCVLWCIFSSLPQPFMAVPAYLFVEVFRQVFAPGLGFAAGAMTYVAMFELLAESVEHLSHATALTILAVSATAMAIVRRRCLHACVCGTGLTRGIVGAGGAAERHANVESCVYAAVFTNTWKPLFFLFESAVHPESSAR